MIPYYHTQPIYTTVGIGSSTGTSSWEYTEATCNVAEYNRVEITSSNGCRTCNSDLEFIELPRYEEPEQKPKSQPRWVFGGEKLPRSAMDVNKKRESRQFDAKSVVVRPHVPVRLDGRGYL